MEDCGAVSFMSSLESRPANTTIPKHQLVLRSEQPRRSRWPISSAYDWPDHSRAPWNWLTALFGASHTTSPTPARCHQTVSHKSNWTSTVPDHVQSYFTHSAMTVVDILETFEYGTAFVLQKFRSCCHYQKASCKCSPLLYKTLVRVTAIAQNCTTLIQRWMHNCQQHSNEVLFCKLHTFISRLEKQTIKLSQTAVFCYVCIPDGLKHRRNICWYDWMLLIWKQLMNTQKHYIQAWSLEFDISN